MSVLSTILWVVLSVGALQEDELTQTETWTEGDKEQQLKKHAKVDKLEACVEDMEYAGWDHTGGGSARCIIVWRVSCAPMPLTGARQKSQQW